MFEMTISGDIALGQSTHKWSCGAVELWKVDPRRFCCKHLYTIYPHLPEGKTWRDIAPDIFFFGDDANYYPNNAFTEIINENT